MRRSSFVAALFAAVVVAGCAKPEPKTSVSSEIAARLGQYTPVKLEVDTTALTPRQRQMLPLLVAAARQMNAAYWQEAYGNGDSQLATLSDPQLRRYVEINVGPWDRLDDFAAFVPGVGPRPAGANYYPHDMTRAGFASAVAGGGAHADSLRNLYSMVRRDAAGRLVAIPYHEFFKAQHDTAAADLDSAARLAEDSGFKRYLTLRAQALRTDDYQASDFAWMDMKTNTLELVIGPIETYEDGKADILGLYMIRQLHGQGGLGKESIDDNYVTFLASLLRAVRFGGSDAHGRANIVAFNFLESQGAFTRDSASHRYHVDFAKFRDGADSLARIILTLQGNGDYDGVGVLNAKYGTITPTLQRDLDRLRNKGIPVDITYEQQYAGRREDGGRPGGDAGRGVTRAARVARWDSPPAPAGPCALPPIRCT